MNKNLLRRYKLDDNNNPVPCESIIEAIEWMVQNMNRLRVGFTSAHGYEVVTTFIGIDLRFFLENGDPLLWETLITAPGNGDGPKIRYSTYKDAKKGHEEAVSRYIMGNN